MLKKDKKEYVFTRLNELLKPQGYKLNKTGLDPKSQKVISLSSNVIAFIDTQNFVVEEKYKTRHIRTC